MESKQQPLHPLKKTSQGFPRRSDKDNVSNNNRRLHMKYTLAEFKARHGRQWKARLREFWLRGVDLGPELQALRNSGKLK
jgi:hypothetical protein